jgi:hypothetical protein
MNFSEFQVYFLVERQPPEEWASGGVLDVVGSDAPPPHDGIGNVIRRKFNSDSGAVVGSHLVSLSQREEI